ncbi:MAG: phosphohydrolase [Bacteroidetes bacterium]|nr:MAG: phosphohydrolase [Bacteroidota bacterium]
MNKKKILNDPVYGFVTIPTELIFDLIEHPYFQRLRRIKQMGLSHYVYPGALHTRFHHALGAMHLMHRAIETLRTKGVEITSEEAEGSLMAILLHDIGHGPYSHTLEGLLLNCSHEDLTLLYMRQLNVEFDNRLEMAISIFEGAHPKKFLHQLITGQLDLDRMDYLKRDSFFSGVTEGNIGHDRIITMLDVRDNEIVVEQKGRYSVEQFLMARRLMYWQVYLHKASLAAERMLRQLIRLTRVALQEGKSIPGMPRRLESFLIGHVNPLKSDNPSTILDEFSKLDDVDVIFALKTIADSDHKLLSYLAKSILQRNLFHTQFLDTRASEGYIGKLASKAAEHLDLSLEDGAKTIIEGYESIPTYRTGNDEIKMLVKSGEVLPLSYLLELRHDAVTETHFLCFPKAIRGSSF